MKRFLLALMILLLVGLLLAGCAQPATSGGAATSSTNSGAAVDGKTLLETRCVSCHSLAKVASQHGDAAFWQRVVSNMVSKGAQLNADEQKVLVEYLAANFQ